MKEIICDLCHGKSKDSPIEGCRSCGGHGIIASKYTLACGCETWLRPGNGATMFHGKTFPSYSGAQVTVFLRGGLCVYYCSEHVEDFEKEKPAMNP